MRNRFRFAPRLRGGPGRTVAVLLLACIVCLPLMACGGCIARQQTSSRDEAGTAAPRTDAARAEKTSSAHEIRAADLPAEGWQTLQLIKGGGPFPYPRDGTVFGNREGLLPANPRGYYREYTVPTPGARDRGARRIVAGRNGEYFYTDDHYRSFRRIRE